MALDKTTIEGFFDEIINKKNSKKEITSEIKTAFETFAEENKVSLKGLKSYLKDYETLKKNSAEFSEIDTARDTFTNLLLPTTAVIETTEEG